MLRNRLGIRQAKNLQQAAFEMTALRAATLPLGRGCAAYPICALFIISCIRICLTGRANSRSEPLQGDTPFCHFARIEKEGNALMQALEQEDYLSGLPRDLHRTPELVLW
jgi:cell filamentation protein